MRTCFRPLDAPSISPAGRDSARSGWPGAAWTCAGLDVSAVAIDHAREAARLAGVGDHCRFDVLDLDDGLPTGPPVDVILCHKFRDRRLDRVDHRTLGAGWATGDRRAQRSRRGPGAVPRSSRRATRRFRRTRPGRRRRRRGSCMAAGASLMIQDSSLARTAASRSSSSDSSMTPRATSECASATSRFSG